MEKVIKIGDQEITLKANALNLLIYQEEFGEDMFKAKGELLKTFGSDGIRYDEISSVTLLRLIWTMARTYDEKFPPFREWVGSLDEIPVVALYNDNVNLFLTNMLPKSDIKN